MSKVSVVIPCYNSEKYIDRCLKSFAVQTYKDFEIIIVDDCSKDNSIKEIEKKNKEYNLRISVIKNETNLGPSLARKEGIEKSNSEYISFCDSDDTIEPHFIEAMINEINKGNDVVFCNYNVILSGQRKRKKWISKPFTKTDIIAEGADSLCCLMVKKNIIQEIVFPNIRNGEDMAIVPVVVAHAEKVGYVDDYIYNYIYRPTSLSNSKDEIVLNYLQFSFDYIYNELNEKYHHECIFLGIRNYLYGSLICIFKKKRVDFETVEKIFKDIKEKDNDWKNNRYMKKLSIHRYWFIMMAEKKMYGICRLMAYVHNILT